MESAAAVTSWTAVETAGKTALPRRSGLTANVVGSNLVVFGGELATAVHDVPPVVLCRSQLCVLRCNPSRACRAGLEAGAGLAGPAPSAEAYVAELAAGRKGEDTVTATSSSAWQHPRARSEYSR